MSYDKLKIPGTPSNSLPDTTVRVISTLDMLQLQEEIQDYADPEFKIGLAHLSTGKSKDELKNMPYFLFLPLLTEIMDINKGLGSQAVDSEKKTS